jgi:hypothetical protein
MMPASRHGGAYGGRQMTQVHILAIDLAKELVQGSISTFCIYVAGSKIG